jgi:hypothetical protein
MVKFIPISIGLNCSNRQLIDAVWPDAKIPYFPWDWSITFKMEYCAYAINNMFKGYYSYVYINNKHKKLDEQKIQKLITEDQTQRQTKRNVVGGSGVINNVPNKSNMNQIHRNYPGIMEVHYHLDNAEDREIISRRVDRILHAVHSPVPILFIRLVMQGKYTTGYPEIFHSLTFEKGLDDCKTFLKTLKIPDKKIVKIVYIHMTYGHKKINHTTVSSKRIDAHKFTFVKKQSDIWERYLMPVLHKYQIHKTL